jgi:hypothetical protein
MFHGLADNGKAWPKAIWRHRVLVLKATQESDFKKLDSKYTFCKMGIRVIITDESSFSICYY